MKNYTLPAIIVVLLAVLGGGIALRNGEDASHKTANEEKVAASFMEDVQQNAIHGECESSSVYFEKLNQLGAQEAAISQQEFTAMQKCVLQQHKLRAWLMPITDKVPEVYLTGENTSKDYLKSGDDFDDSGNVVELILAEYKTIDEDKFLTTAQKEAKKAEIAKTTPTLQGLAKVYFTKRVASIAKYYPEKQAYALSSLMGSGALSVTIDHTKLDRAYTNAMGATVTGKTELWQVYKVLPSKQVSLNPFIKIPAEHARAAEGHVALLAQYRLAPSLLVQYERVEPAERTFSRPDEKTWEYWKAQSEFLEYIVYNNITGEIYWRSGAI